MQHAGRDVVTAIGVITERIADHAPVDPGLVHLVDRAQVDSSRRLRLGRTQLEVRAVPDEPVEILELSNAPIAPVPKLRRRRRANDCA